MSKRVYTKSPLSFQEQINLLKDRGLKVNNESKAISYLQSISYYRLSAYFLPYQLEKDTFNEGVTFKQIIDTYSFDRELRLLVFNCIERIEIAIRTQIIYSMALHYNDSHWQDKKKYFRKYYHKWKKREIDPYKELRSIIKRAKSSNQPEVFIKHYKDNYFKPKNPPSWMCLEVLTLGELSQLFKGLAENSDRKRIASYFDLHQNVLESWLHSLTYVRNLCAHHARLWNRELGVVPEVLKKPVGNWIDEAFNNNRRVFYFINVLKYLLNRANPNNSLKQKLEALFKKYPDIPIQYLGIPSEDGLLLNWKKQPIWSEE